MSFKDIDINPQFAKALHMMEEDNKNVFITGKAGTGKSTLLEYFRLITKKNVVTLAPTGVAAVNISGQTIHSFFGFRPDVTPEKVRQEANKQASSIYKSLDAIVIDEISMVRADLLDCVDEFLRINGKQPGLPFGGIQMILIGDLYQIPPVVTRHDRFVIDGYYDSEFFFDARSFADIEIKYLELETIYRQTEQNFIDLLNKIRNKTASEEELALLNNRVIDHNTTLPEDVIYLTTTNDMAEKRNKAELAKLPGHSYFFTAEVTGMIDKKSFPADEVLEIKTGAQVMLLNNDAAGRWINGTIATIAGINEDSLEIKLDDEEVEEVTPYKWDLYRFFWDKESQAVGTESIGSFRQYPLKLAWAITIHKSQGKTFDNVVIDLGKGVFASGQLYVALSRCRSLNGIFLQRELNPSDIRIDFRVVKFITEWQYYSSEEKLPLDDKVEIIKNATQNENDLEIIYLKNTDEKTKRMVRPEKVGTMYYNGKKFIGMEAYCFERKERRTFRVDRILQIKSGNTIYEIEEPAAEHKNIFTGTAGCIDVETTGLDPYTDEVIELGLVLFSYDRSGITGIIDTYSGLREPRGEISRGAYNVHGLAKEHLIGHQLDTEKIKSMLEQADFLIAHNASFDKGFVTKLFPSAKKMRWYCTMRGIRWQGRRSLQGLLHEHDILPVQSHRALDDAKSVISLLAQKNSRGETYFAEMLGRLPFN